LDTGTIKSAGHDWFLTDPLQANREGDWPKDNSKVKYMGITQDQIMTPETSAEAALKWLRYKGFLHDAKGKETTYKGDFGALRDYNGNKNLDKIIDSKKVEHRDWYGKMVVNLEKAMLAQEEANNKYKHYDKKVEALMELKKPEYEENYEIKDKEKYLRMVNKKEKKMYRYNRLTNTWEEWIVDSGWIDVTGTMDIMDETYQTDDWEWYFYYDPTYILNSQRIYY